MKIFIICGTCKTKVLQMPPDTSLFSSSSADQKKTDGYGLKLASHVKVTEPASYLRIISNRLECEAVLKDSGGVQKEVFFFRKPCTTIRGSTGLVEMVNSDWNTLTGSDKKLSPLLKILT